MAQKKNAKGIWVGGRTLSKADMSSGTAFAQGVLVHNPYYNPEKDSTDKKQIYIGSPYYGNDFAPKLDKKGRVNCKRTPWSNIVTDRAGKCNCLMSCFAVCCQSITANCCDAPRQTYRDFQTWRNTRYNSRGEPLLREGPDNLTFFGYACMMVANPVANWFAAPDPNNPEEGCCSSIQGMICKMLCIICGVITLVCLLLHCCVKVFHDCVKGNPLWRAHDKGNPHCHMAVRINNQCYSLQTEWINGVQTVKISEEKNEYFKLTKVENENFFEAKKGTLPFDQYNWKQIELPPDFEMKKTDAEIKAHAFRWHKRKYDLASNNCIDFVEDLANAALGSLSYVDLDGLERGP